MLSSPPFFRLSLVGFVSGLTLSLPASAVACLLTAVWSVIICCAKALTSLFLVLPLASLPASMSTWLAVTTMCAICGSVGPAPCASARKGTAASAARPFRIFMGFSLCVPPWTPRIARAFPGTWGRAMIANRSQEQCHGRARRRQGKHAVDGRAAQRVPRGKGLQVAHGAGLWRDLRPLGGRCHPPPRGAGCGFEHAHRHARQFTGRSPR